MFQCIVGVVNYIYGIYGHCGGIQEYSSGGACHCSADCCRGRNEEASAMSRFQDEDK